MTRSEREAMAAAWVNVPAPRLRDELAGALLYHDGLRSGAFTGDFRESHDRLLALLTAYRAATGEAHFTLPGTGRLVACLSPEGELVVVRRHHQRAPRKSGKPQPQPKLPEVCP